MTILGKQVQSCEDRPHIKFETETAYRQESSGFAGSLISEFPPKNWLPIILFDGAVVKLIEGQSLNKQALCSNPGCLSVCAFVFALLLSAYLLNNIKRDHQWSTVHEEGKAVWMPYTSLRRKQKTYIILLSRNYQSVSMGLSALLSVVNVCALGFVFSFSVAHSKSKS